MALKKEEKKKWHGPLSHWGREGKTLRGPTTKKKKLYASSLIYPENSGVFLKRS